MKVLGLICVVLFLCLFVWIAGSGGDYGDSLEQM